MEKSSNANPGHEMPCASSNNPDSVQSRTGGKRPGLMLLEIRNDRSRCAKLRMGSAKPNSVKSDVGGMLSKRPALNSSNNKPMAAVPLRGRCKPSCKESGAEVKKSKRAVLKVGEVESGRTTDRMDMIRPD